MGVALVRWRTLGPPGDSIVSAGRSPCRSGPWRCLRLQPLPRPRGRGRGRIERFRGDVRAEYGAFEPSPEGDGALGSVVENQMDPVGASVLRTDHGGEKSHAKPYRSDSIRSRGRPAFISAQ
jgi:hypothetical protein